MYTPCRPTGVWVHRAAWLGVLLLGPHVLPGEKYVWRPPVNQQPWAKISESWRQELGLFDTMAVYQHPQTKRPGVMLLLIHLGRPIAFVKLWKGNGSALHAEAQAQSAVWRFQPNSFRVPEPRALGEQSGWHYFAAAPLPARPHRVPKKPPLNLIVGEIDAALADIARPPKIPGHWRPMHGDLTPWNLRQFPDRTLVLIDWENSGWGPPGADEVLYKASIAALRRDPPSPSNAHEAIAFWEARIRNRRASGKRDRRLARGLLKTFERMRSSD